MRLVIDTNIVVSALFWNGAPARLFEAVVATDVAVISSDRLINELRSTLEKPNLATKVAATGLPPDHWIAKYKAFCALVEPVVLPQPIAPDPDDDWVIATAAAANADLIVTGDKPLLSVGSVGLIRIVGVAQALELLGAG